MYLFLTLSDWLMEGQLLTDLIFTSEGLLKLGLSIFFGILLYGTTFWFLNERRYKKWKEHQS
jgi:hypothetical protein